MRRTNKKSAKHGSVNVAQEKRDQALDLKSYLSAARAQRQAEAQRCEQLAQLRPARKPVDRDLSKIDFQAQHWWGDGQILKRYVKDGKIQRKMQVDEAKAALIYEAMRRRQEVQQTWVDGNFDIRPKGYQEFVGMTVQHLPCSWMMLDDMTKQTFVDAMQSPWFVPPLGYSTFPDKSTPGKCEAVAIQKLPGLPKADDPAPNYLEYLRRFEDAGFIFVAIDHKSRQRDKYALNALGKLLADLPPTCRKADFRTVIEHHLPPDVSLEERTPLTKKAKQGTLTQQDLDELWRNHIKPTRNLLPPWHTRATLHTLVTGKRQRKTQRCNVLVEDMRFDFQRLFAELTDLDSGKIQHSDFVARLRL